MSTNLNNFIRLARYAPQSQLGAHRVRSFAAANREALVHAGALIRIGALDYVYPERLETYIVQVGSDAASKATK